VNRTVTDLAIPDPASHQPLAFPTSHVRSLAWLTLIVMAPLLTHDLMSAPKQRLKGIYRAQTQNYASCATRPLKSLKKLEKAGTDAVSRGFLLP
jgi:hypothetical protein